LENIGQHKQKKRISKLNTTTADRQLQVDCCLIQITLQVIILWSAEFLVYFITLCHSRLFPLIFV